MTTRDVRMIRALGAELERAARCPMRRVPIIGRPFQRRFQRIKADYLWHVERLTGVRGYNFD